VDLAVIDQLAIQATKGEDFVGYQRNKTYLHGRFRGQPKKYWLVDGNKFEKLWKVILPYVAVSVQRSGYYTSNSEREDILEDIKIWFYKILYNYGPKPNDKPFSKQVTLTVNNALTNYYKNAQSAKKYLNYNAISLFTATTNDDTPILNTIEDNSFTTDFREREIVAHLNETEQAMVLFYFKCEQLKLTCEEFHVSPKRLKNILRSCLN